jgi:hypothetical protein
MLLLPSMEAVCHDNADKQSIREPDFHRNPPIVHSPQKKFSAVWTARWLIETKRSWLTIAITLLASCTLVESSSAQPVPGTAPATPLDAKELDRYFADQLSRKPFVGISVALVQGGKDNLLQRLRLRLKVNKQDGRYRNEVRTGFDYKTVYSRLHFPAL